LWERKQKEGRDQLILLFSFFLCVYFTSKQQQQQQQQLLRIHKDANKKREQKREN
jgi:hypothetical protein